jgi:hypothetical protein
MNGKHESQCNCVDCLLYLERETYVDLDEWMPTDEHVQRMLGSTLDVDILPSYELTRGHDVDFDEWMPTNEHVQRMLGSTLDVDTLPSYELTRGHDQRSTTLHQDCIVPILRSQVMDDQNGMARQLIGSSDSTPIGSCDGNYMSVIGPTHYGCEGLERLAPVIGHISHTHVKSYSPTEP